MKATVGVPLTGRRLCRTVAFVGGTVLVVASSAACSPDVRGALALTRTGDGELLVVFATCGAEYEGVQLGAGPLARSDDEETATWRHDGDIDDASSLPLTAADPGDEWTVVSAWSGIEDETYGYDLRAGQLTSDERGIDYRSPVSSAFAFPGDLLTELEPGELLHRDFGGSREVIVDRQTVQAFRSSVCDGR